MIRDPAGAVTVSAFQRIECFCRTRIFSFLRSHWPSLGLAVAAMCSTIYAGTSTSSERTDSSPRIFTLTEAVETALQRNPNILRARQEIERTKGLQIQVRAQALPHLDATASYTKTDPKLQGGGGGSTFITTTITPTPGPSATASPAPTPVTTTTTIANASGTTTQSYDLTLTASQLLYNGSVIPAIRGAGFSRDASFFALSDTIDIVIATVREQFYLVILNKQLIGVQEESVRLLESQLKDQQNRFEAGTVPRFNVLQAEVALANQQPQLISAKNNYLISEYQLAKTLGIDPGPQGQTTYHAVGSLEVHDRPLGLRNAIQMGIEHRPFLKVQRLTILIQKEQVKVALAGYKPQLNANGGYEVRNAAATSHLDDTIDGWFFGVTGQ